MKTKLPLIQSIYRKKLLFLYYIADRSSRNLVGAAKMSPSLTKAYLLLPMPHQAPPSEWTY